MTRRNGSPPRESIRLPLAPVRGLSGPFLQRFSFRDPGLHHNLRQGFCDLTSAYISADGQRRPELHEPVPAAGAYVRYNELVCVSLCVHTRRRKASKALDPIYRLIDVRFGCSPQRNRPIDRNCVRALTRGDKDNPISNSIKVMKNKMKAGAGASHSSRPATATLTNTKRAIRDLA